VLRLDDCEDHRPRARPAGGDRPDAPNARDDGHRGHPDVRAAAPADPRGAGLPGGAPGDGVHGPVHAAAKKNRPGGIGLISLPPLQAIVDAEAAAAAGWQPADVARAVLDGGATLLQIRAKALPSGPFLDLCEAVVSIAGP